MLEPGAATKAILTSLADLAPLPAERVPLERAAGRALAEDLLAPRSLPPFDSSQMDGYALRAADARGRGAKLPVAFTVYAGAAPGRALEPGSCARIFTGAPLPAGADCVEMQEEVAQRGGSARFNRPAVAGRFVRQAGSDLRTGEPALRAGAVLGPGAIGLLAALGRMEVAVPRRPRVGILATGDEIAAADRPLEPGQIADSNSHLLFAACREAGGEPLLLPIARDTRASLAAALRGAAGCDLLVCIGGVSVGERDLVRDALAAAGAKLAFWRVAMRPGKPITFGRWDRCAVFGLPGNPASAMVTFELFARPAIRALAGLSGSGRSVLPARLATPQTKDPALTHYLRAETFVDGRTLWVKPLPSQKSGDLTSIVGAEALAVLPKRVARLARGAWIEAILLGEAPPRVQAHRRISLAGVAST
jgi:molybdopterin molybdotransferase